MWLQGYQALIRWRAENEITGVHAVPYDVEVGVGVTKSFPLGRWVHQQRKALRAGELEERRKTLLDAPEAGMVWEPGEETWENKLAALRLSAYSCECSTEYGDTCTSREAVSQPRHCAGMAVAGR